jgi:multicomponent Na+:H+ antiporter subunit E
MFGRPPGYPGRMPVLARRTFALSCWCYLIWVLLTWTETAEQLLIGAGISILAGLALAPLGPVPGPWRLLVPRNASAAVRLFATALMRIPVANLRLAVRIWRPSRPLRSGMVVVPTRERTDLGLTTVGLVTSLIVDNQIVDLDRRDHVLQYHAVDVPEGTPEQKRAAINEPVERCLEGLRTDEP